MPVKPTDTSKDRLQEAGPDINGGKKKNSGNEAGTGAETEPNQVNYGFGQRAELDTSGEETQPQEYKEGGLMETQDYGAADAAKASERRRGEARHPAE